MLHIKDILVKTDNPNFFFFNFRGWLSQAFSYKINYYTISTKYFPGSIFKTVPQVTTSMMIHDYMNSYEHLNCFYRICLCTWHKAQNVHRDIVSKRPSVFELFISVVL